MRAKTKVVKVPVGDGSSKEINDMFNQLIGAGSTNMTITYPRYLTARTYCDQLRKLFIILRDSPPMRTMPESHESIGAFCKYVETCHEQLFVADVGRFINNLEECDEPTRENFTVVYNALKQSELLAKYVGMCNRLIPYHKNFSDRTCMNKKFITCMPGVDWSPFPFKLNLKQLFMVIDDNTINLFMTALNKSFEFSKKLYDEMQKPDVDVSSFVELLLKNIIQLQKVPELSRCKQAFKKITDSLKMLETNFTGYYRHFVETQNSSIILEHFILDVSNQMTADAVVAGQFRQIISYYRKVAAKQSVKDPRVSALFNTLSKSFPGASEDTTNLRNYEKNGGATSDIGDTITDDTVTDNTTDDTGEVVGAIGLSAEDIQAKK